ncbi:RCC1 domain-containing protein 1 isoform X2 [Rhinatrema bivittatum]|uniref:RCC1 domain-containing protein 1 isoform X2 n=1 Tax=Rhinatrema bivittatum TaxID=194408 RepID=UPI00112C6461|nr:RCC1 domain-containing protein 1 isoform X2 [Rhinatrema bivittatum]
MEAPCWVGFGFVGFRPVPEQESPVELHPRPLPLPLGGRQPGIAKLRPCWSYAAALTVLPLLSTGYVSLKPPFFKELPHHLRAQKLVLGNEHALLLSTDWTVYSWGSGRHGQLGHRGLEDVSEPRTVEALHGMPMGDVAAGGWHSVSVSEAGDIYVWGWNESGQLGLPCKTLSKVTKRTTAVLQEGMGAGRNSVEKISHEGEATKACENDFRAEFISVQAFPALLDLPEGAEAAKAGCGSRHTAVVTRHGSLYTWGWGKYGQLGHRDTASSDYPKLVEYFSQQQLYVQDVVCGSWSTYVLTVESK